jgi:hypothetical protein
LTPVVAGLGSGLVAASPDRPAKSVDRVKDGPVDERDEQSLDLVTSERYQLVGRGMTLVFVRAEDSEEGMREHGQGDPAGPGRVSADLVLVQAARPLPDWKNSLTRHLDPATRTRVVSGTAAGE